MTRNWEKLWANSQRGPEDFSPIVQEDLNPAKNHMSLEADTYPVEPLGKTIALADTLKAALWQSLKQRDPAKPHLDSWLGFVLICYAAINDKYRKYYCYLTFQMRMLRLKYQVSDRDRIWSGNNSSRVSPLNHRARLPHNWMQVLCLNWTIDCNIASDFKSRKQLRVNCKKV